MRLHLPRARFLVLAAALSIAPNAPAQEQVFHLDPSRSQVEFTLGASLHTVHGTFRMHGGDLRLDPATGKASGAIVVDATSGNTGNAGRDRKMHKEVLQSAQYPEIRFTLQAAQGSLPANGSSEIQLSGVMTLHGGDHPMTVTAPVRISNGEASADVQFAIPYVEWGMKDPSTFLLRVGKKVDIVVHAVGSLTPAPKS